MAGYGDDGGFEAWLTAYGYVLPGSAPALAVLRQRGSSYIDGEYGPRFPGSPTGGLAQERAWPRTAASAFGVAIPDNEIPVQVVEASYYAAYQEAIKPGSLQGSVTSAGQLKFEKIDVIEREFFEGKGGTIDNATPKFTFIEGLLAPFIGSRTTLGAVAVV